MYFYLSYTNSSRTPEGRRSTSKVASLLIHGTTVPIGRPLTPFYPLKLLQEACMGFLTTLMYSGQMHFFLIVFDACKSTTVVLANSVSCNDWPSASQMAHSH